MGVELGEDQREGLLGEAVHIRRVDVVLLDERIDFAELTSRSASASNAEVAGGEYAQEEDQDGDKPVGDSTQEVGLTLGAR